MRQVLRERVPEWSGALYSFYIDPLGGWGRGKPSPPAQLHLERRSTALVQEARERTLTRAGGGGRMRGHLASRPERSMALSSPRTSFPIKAKNPLTGAPRARPVAPFSLHQTAPWHPGSLQESPSHPATFISRMGPPPPALPTLVGCWRRGMGGWERDRRKERGAGCQLSSWAHSHLSAPRKTRSKRGREETGEAAMLFEPLQL